MRLFDTHGHLSDGAFDADRREVIARLRAEGLEYAIVVADPCERIPNQDAVHALLTEYPFLYGAIGVHPQNADRYDESVEATLREYLAIKKFVCLGEIGLDDHFEDNPEHAVQRDVFVRQLALAKELHMPAQLHIRDAHGDCLDITRKLYRENALPTCILHCYSGSLESAKLYLDMGMYISFSGSVTFKNAGKLKETAAYVPADRILTETDCPYLAPDPLRGKRNEPAYVARTTVCVANLRGVHPEDMARQMTENALRVFQMGEVL